MKVKQIMAIAIWLIVLYAVFGIMVQFKTGLGLLAFFSLLNGTIILLIFLKFLERVVVYLVSTAIVLWIGIPKWG